MENSKYYGTANKITFALFLKIFQIAKYYFINKERHIRSEEKRLSELLLRKLLFKKMEF